MKFKYIITIDSDEERAVCVSQEQKPGVISVMIIARTPEEATKLFQGVTAT